MKFASVEHEYFFCIILLKKLYLLKLIFIKLIEPGNYIVDNLLFINKKLKTTTSVGVGNNQLDVFWLIYPSG